MELIQRKGTKRGPYWQQGSLRGPQCAPCVLLRVNQLDASLRARVVRCHNNKLN